MRSWQSIFIVYSLVRNDYNTCRIQDPCIIRPSVQLGKHGLKGKVVLNWWDIGIENVRL